MIEDVRLARLGDTVDEVVIIEWFVDVGAVVAAGEALVLVETDKVEVEIDAPLGGTLVERLVDQGDEAATGAILCRIDTSS